MLSEREIMQAQKSLGQEAPERLAFVFQALADPTRLRMFRLFAEEKDLCVTDIANILEVSVPAVSYQLKLMEVVGLVKKERMGRMICYKLKKEDPTVRRLLNIVL